MPRTGQPTTGELRPGETDAGDETGTPRSKKHVKRAVRDDAGAATLVGFARIVQRTNAQNDERNTRGDFVVEQRRQTAAYEAGRVPSVTGKITPVLGKILLVSKLLHELAATCRALRSLQCARCR